MPDVSVAVVGAGPYGLSVAAHLRGRQIDTAVFGKPMALWEQLPARMYLKSPLSASSLSAPGGRYGLAQYLTPSEEVCEEAGEAPISLRQFVA